MQVRLVSGVGASKVETTTTEVRRVEKGHPQKGKNDDGDMEYDVKSMGLVGYEKETDKAFYIEIPRDGNMIVLMNDNGQTTEVIKPPPVKEVSDD